MLVLKMDRDIHQDIYDLARVADLSNQWLHETYDTWEKLQGNPVTQTLFKSDIFSKESRKFIQEAKRITLKLPDLDMHSLKEEDENAFFALSRDLGLIEDTFERMLDAREKYREVQERKRKKFKKKHFDPDSLEYILEEIGKHGIGRFESKTFKRDWATNFGNDKDSINDFLFLGDKPLPEIKKVFLEVPRMAKFDRDKQEWMVDEEPAYKIFGGQTTKELWTQLLELFGFKDIPKYDKIESRRRLETHVKFLEDKESGVIPAFEKVVDTIGSDNVEDYEYLFDVDGFEYIESLLYDLVIDAVNKFEKMGASDEVNEQDEKDLERYLTTIEFLMAVMVERKDDIHIDKRVIQELQDIRQPREFEQDRRFPKLEKAHDVWEKKQ